MAKLREYFAQSLATLNILSNLSMFAFIGSFGNWLIKHYTDATRWFWDKFFELMPWLHVRLSVDEKDSLTVLLFFLPMFIQACAKFLELRRDEGFDDLQNEEQLRQWRRQQWQRQQMTVSLPMTLVAFFGAFAIVYVTSRHTFNALFSLTENAQPLYNISDLLRRMSPDITPAGWFGILLAMGIASFAIQHLYLYVRYGKNKALHKAKTFELHKQMDKPSGRMESVFWTACCLTGFFLLFLYNNPAVAGINTFQLSMLVATTVMIVVTTTTNPRVILNIMGIVGLILASALVWDTLMDARSQIEARH